MASQPTTAEEEVAHHKPQALWALVLGSVGVVYGDIGTSPLYALREALTGAMEDGLLRTEIIGVVSLLLWTLMLIVSIKYVVLIMRADNRGEGGTLSLVALAQQAFGRRTAPILVLGVLGTALFFGDAIITPAISVLSAVEGLKLVTPALDQFVIPLTLIIIFGVFWVQHIGTEGVSRYFGPITLVWFIVMGILGISHIGDDIGILLALNPYYAVEFLFEHGFTSLPVMGSVFLAVTGAEALYADMGHFGRKPIRIAWGVVVFPALMLSYLGQGALVLNDPTAVVNPFYLLAPDWFLLPLVILATAATVIACQAVISGAFSMARQAVQMGLMPRLEVRHTSERQVGQIFMPQVNRMLFMGVVALVLAFGSSASLASAYGIAVTGTMVTTTLLGAVVFRRLWKWSKTSIALVFGPFLLLETMFLVANLSKFVDGGWVPLSLAVLVCVMIWTWMRGTAYVQRKARQGAVTLEKLIEMLGKSKRLLEVPGTAVFLTSDPETAPSALMHNIKHNQVLHKLNMIVTVQVANTPYVAEADRLIVEPLNERFTRVRMAFGYMEEPNVPKALMLARRQGQKFDIMSTSFFLNRRSFRSAQNEGLPAWQERLFVGMTKQASNATDFYRLPVNRVIELGQQLAI
ncbi:MAG: potassium transporter Kup [Cereibacter sphaeroides]|uniref:Probable potassium transport system protein Kup n=1 Tax=Cereibacter sphaeroides TaxID=1063 RepID=A0A2W5RYH4_CERSP|nr:MAG: potassium transporter Kup [Cereibacter sphaeroides]